MTSSAGPAQIAALNQLILRSIVDHAVVTISAEGLVTSWNEGAERILGWSEDEIVGQPADVFFTADDTEHGRAQEEMRLAIEHGRAEDVRWHLRKNGERFWGSGLMMPLLNETNVDGSAIRDPDKIDGFVKIFRDQTAEREAELRIARLQDRARLAMRRSGIVGVFDNDLKTGVIVADTTCARLHGVDAETAEGGASVDRFFAGIVAKDRAAARGALEAAAERGEDVDVIYRVKSSGAKPVWVQSQGSVQTDEDGRPEHLVGIVIDITEDREQIRMQEARLEFADKVRDIASQVEIAKLASRVIGETIHASRVGYGYVKDDGNTIVVEADWNAGDGQSIVGRHRFSDFGSFAPALQRGETVIIEDSETDTRIDSAERLRNIGVRAVVNLPLMERDKLKAILFVNSAEPRKWSEAEITFLGAMVDRTYAAIDRLRVAEERDILAEELAHRMKNILALAQVVVRQSLRGVEGLDAERSAIDTRLQALSAAQDVLTGGREKEADIRSVVASALAPHLPDGDRAEISGPFLQLQSQQVLGLTLALHELATNAAKYGALSNEVGRVRIDWSRDGDAFRFLWTEHGGPSVTASSSKGFGSKILQSAAGGYFDGRSTLHFQPDGVRFEIEGTIG
ncbi:PAS domain S-box-containing protein [Palleronia aestuarii]|uniref:histidine kinase n=1 Tax=Palleronia aestuarii TaxID=568105 RepID=A0A2W7PNG0_9RHOB|nr:HWE histidine kinase domain-containing protein [Palleronia aestuarii]PZX10899.1 PAS domain S-box-containing protein [Palleronia aestuarii]